MSEQISREEFEALKEQVKVNRRVAIIAVSIGVGTLAGYLLGYLLAINFS